MEPLTSLEQEMWNHIPEGHFNEYCVCCQGQCEGLYHGWLPECKEEVHG